MTVNAVPRRTAVTVVRPLGLLALAMLTACAEPAPVAESSDVVAPEPADPNVVATLFDPALRPYELSGPLVPASASMVSAWDIPDHPLAAADLEGAAGDEVRWGYQLFMNTPAAAPRLTPSQMSCGNCHLNAGQRELALPLVGSAGMFPEYNRRAGYDFTLEDRIVGCFMRSMNATDGVDEDGNPPEGRVTPAPELEEIGALAAYIRWVSRNHGEGENPPWRKRNRIPEDALLPLDQLDTELGEELFVIHCAQCHGEDGQGVQIGDKKAGPLWGPGSWNDGAGAARVYTLAGMIRFMMPYLNPGVLTDDEAQHIAAYITTKPRPSYPYKDQDYQTEPRPIDAVYYDR